jgi:uncharacterized protein with NRDE domain
MGTWLGVNETGLVVAVTNRQDGELPYQRQTRSRGLLAVALLSFDDPREAALAAEAELSQGGFGGSNFLIASPSSAYVIHAPGARTVGIRQLEPGVHAVTNLDLDDPKDPRIRLIRENLDPGRFVTSGSALCRHEEIVISGLNRGTVSSSLVLVGQGIDLHHLLGNPERGVYNRHHLESRR